MEENNTYIPEVLINFTIVVADKGYLLVILNLPFEYGLKVTTDTINSDVKLPYGYTGNEFIRDNYQTTPTKYRFNLISTGGTIHVSYNVNYYWLMKNLS